MVKALDDQGVEFAWVLPSLGLGVEEMLKDDREGLPAVARAYNMWLDDDWGYYRDGCIQTAPFRLGDPYVAEAELHRVIERGADLVVMRPAPVVSVAGPRSLGAIPRTIRAGRRRPKPAWWSRRRGRRRLHVRGDWGENVRYTGLKQSAFSEVLSIHSERPIFDAYGGDGVPRRVRPASEAARSPPSSSDRAGCPTSSGDSVLCW